MCWHSEGHPRHHCPCFLVRRGKRMTLLLDSPTQILCYSCFEARKRPSCRTGGAQSLWSRGFLSKKKYLVNLGYCGRECCQAVLFNCFTDHKCKAVTASKLLFSLSLSSPFKDVGVTCSFEHTTQLLRLGLFKDLITYLG